MPVLRRPGAWIRPIVRVLAPIGLISYGIYVWHDTIVQLIWLHSSTGLRGGGAAWLGDCLLVTAITLSLAAVSWFVIERPSMRAAAGWRATGTRGSRGVSGPQATRLKRSSRPPLPAPASHSTTIH